MTVEEIWRAKTDADVLVAASQLDEYLPDGQQVIRAEMQRRGLTLAPGPLPAPVPRRWPRYGLAVVACGAIVLGYATLGAALGWQQGGGVLVMILVVLALGATWRAITRRRDR